MENSEHGVISHGCMPTKGLQHLEALYFSIEDTRSSRTGCKHGNQQSQDKLQNQLAHGNSTATKDAGLFSCYAPQGHVRLAFVTKGGLAVSVLSDTINENAS